jgi:hypothetical protein
MGDSPGRAESPDVTLSKPYVPGHSPMTPDVRLWHRAVVVHQVRQWYNTAVEGAYGVGVPGVTGVTASEQDLGFEPMTAASGVAVQQ